MPVQSKETPNENYFVALTIALTLPGVSQAAEPKLEVTTLTENIYMLSGKGGGNIGVMTGPDGTFVIDDQLEKIVRCQKCSCEDLLADGNSFQIIL